MNGKRVFTLLLILLLSACEAAQTPGSAPAPESTAELPQATGASTLTASPPAVETAPTSAPTPEEAAAEDGQSADPSPNADVLFVDARLSQEGTWTFAVTVEHDDTGWEDYADGWDVVLPDSTVVKPDEESPFTRLLLHPHENEQPFTRSQSGIVIPDGVQSVTVRAHDLVDGFGGQEITVDLTAESGPGFAVTR